MQFFSIRYRHYRKSNVIRPVTVLIVKYHFRDNYAALSPHPLMKGKEERND